MSKTIRIGTINEMDVLKRIRRDFPRQIEKAQSTPKGKRGYNRKREKIAYVRDE